MSTYDDERSEPTKRYVDVHGRMIELTSDGFATSMRDDGPTNAFWAGPPGTMPKALRDVGLIDPGDFEPEDATDE